MLYLLAGELRPPTFKNCRILNINGTFALYSGRYLRRVVVSEEKLIDFNTD